MKHLSHLLQLKFPNKFIHISEHYDTDEVYNLVTTYHVTIQDEFSKEFNCFRAFEAFVFELL